MTAVLIAEIVSMSLWLVACANDACPTMPDARGAEQIRRERHMSEEERRLDRFWREFYAAQSRYYHELDKLDWVAYYKNHGVQINTDKASSRIQFAPVFVVPRLEPLFPAPANLRTEVRAPLLLTGDLQVPPGLPLAPPPGSVNPLPAIPPSGPAPPKVPTPIKNSPSSTWTLDVKLAESQGAGPAKELRTWPNIHIQLDGTFVVPAENLIALRTGTAADLRATYVQVGLPGGHATLGTEIKGTISHLAPKRVRLNVTLEKQEVENAGKQHLLIVGKTYRLAHQLQLGQRTKVVLQSDAGGEPALWLEVLVAQAEPSPAPLIPPLPAPSPK